MGDWSHHTYIEVNLLFIIQRYLSVNPTYLHYMWEILLFVPLTPLPPLPVCNRCLMWVLMSSTKRYSLLILSVINSFVCFPSAVSCTGICGVWWPGVGQEGVGEGLWGFPAVSTRASAGLGQEEGVRSSSSSSRRRSRRPAAGIQGQTHTVACPGKTCVCYL